jgi:hypothetical protein
MLARLRERRRHPPAAAAGPAAFEASERRAERGARCAEGAPRDARLSLVTVAMRRCRVHLCVSRGGGRRAIGRVGAHRFDAARSSPIAPFHRPLPSGCAPQAPARRLSAVGAASTSSSSSSTSPRSPEPPPLRPSPFRPSPQLSPPGLARAGKFVALANWLRDGRNVLGPAHSGFLWCMTWSMAAMGMNAHVQRWRHRRHRRQARQRVKERVCCQCV